MNTLNKFVLLIAFASCMVIADKCTDDCVAKKLKEDPLAIEALVWHECHYDCNEKKVSVGTELKESPCMEKCLKEEWEKDPEGIAPVIWHRCHFKCEKKQIKAKNETCDQPKCYDKCYCEQKAKGETVEAVIWHICHWQCGDETSFAQQLIKSETPENDQKCWDDCWAEASKTESNPSVIYQICFFKCGPKPPSPSSE